MAYSPVSQKEQIKTIKERNLFFSEAFFRSGIRNS